MGQRNSKNLEEDCVFCKIVDKELDAEIVYEDESFVAFRDIKPDAEIHIQLIPRKHIQDINALTCNDIELVEKLKELGKEIIMNQPGDTHKKLATQKFAFHVPPYNSVNHLHLHCISGRSQFKTHFTHGKIFPWVMTIDSLLDRLRKEKAEAET